MKKIQAMFILALSCMTAFAALASSKLYMVIDLSAGANATTYPISYLDDVPDGGWTDKYKTTKLVLRRIEAGSFLMRGSTTTVLTQPFYMGVFEVTQKQWSLVMGTSPSYFSGDTRPVERVSYNTIRGSSDGSKWPASSAVDVSSFLGKLQMRSGLVVDLPTEAQWEYACRAGTSTTYYWGSSMDGNYAWYSSNSSSSTHVVGTKLPNVWGLYDMSGNVWEWCLDWVGTLAYGTDPRGSSSGSCRISRGGGWSYDADRCTSSYRGCDLLPSRENYNFGFRIVKLLNNSFGGTIIFDANGGADEVEPIEISAGEAIVNLPVISRKGYIFLGWYTEKEGGELLCRGYELNGDVTAYAHWLKENHLESVTEQKGGFVCVQYNSAFALNSLANAIDCVTNAAAWTNTPTAKRYQTIALRANARENSNKVSPYDMVPFPSFTDVSKTYSHVVLAVKGTIEIPEAGKWTFDCGHDDGFRTIIEGNDASFLFEDGEPDEYKHKTTTFDFPVAGRYEVSSIFYECTGGAEFDFSVAKGAYSSFDSSVFKLVGDPASGVEVVVGPDTPEFDPASGTVFESPLSVAISCPTEGATIHYTTDGSEPTEEFPVYKKFRISGKTTVKAIAIDESGYESNVAVAEYALGTCDDPVITPTDGTVFQHANQEVSISCGEEGTLRYTLDGTEPTTNSAAYTGPFTISESTVVKAKVFSEHYFDSQVVTANLTREWVKVETPTNSLRVANSGLSVLVDLGCADGEAEIHYTLDGSDPTAESPIYTKPFYAFDVDTLKVVAVREDYANSTIVTNDIAIYCVVDLSGGPSAENYPMSYRVGVPEGGWTDEYKTTKLVLRKINAGSFIMGEDQTNEAHRVTLTKPFYMGVFEVTQKQWELVMGSNPASGYGVGDTYPVYYVSYDMIRGANKGAQWPASAEVDDDSFLGKLQSRMEISIDLPTEAQWEYACRAGTTTIHSYVDGMDGEYMWYASNSGSVTHNVGTRRKNPWGLYDLYGNVLEWCLDWASDYVGLQRSLRGGSWMDTADYCASSKLFSSTSSLADYYRGFRLVMAPQYPSTPTISPDSGTTFETTSLSVAITCDSDNATIHYTTNGMTPTVESPVYKKFRITDKTTVKAIAFYEDGTPSEMAVAEYAPGRCDDPVISPADGTVFQHANQEVSISCGEEGTLHYTLDGTEPTTNSVVYTGPFAVSTSVVVKAKVFSDKFFDSQVVTANLIREWAKVEALVISAGATFTGSREVVTITCATEDAAIHYTVDGSEPTADSPRYRGAFNVKESCTIKAKAFLEDYLASDVVSVSVTRVYGVGDVLGVPDVMFTDGGALAWAEDTSTEGACGGSSMKSGKITHSQESSLSATVTGKGVFSFYVKTSCEDSGGYYDWDRLEFTADGEMLPLDGERGWTNVVREFTTEGPHTLTWTYIKDNAGSDGNDCAWLSNITWTRTDVDPLPDITTDATPAQIEDALWGAADDRLQARILTGTDYARFRSWADKAAGGDYAHHAAVKESLQAWLSYALDSDKLLTKAPEQGEMKVAAFEKNATTGMFDFAVGIEGVTVGTNATAENLATLFGVEGSSTVDGNYSVQNLSFTFGTPVDGKVIISAEPKDTDATQFFMKVKMVP